MASMGGSLDRQHVFDLGALLCGKPLRAGLGAVALRVLAFASIVQKVLSGFDASRVIKRAVRHCRACRSSDSGRHTCLAAG